jgi:hypothetical protein
MLFLSGILYVFNEYPENFQIPFKWRFPVILTFSIFFVCFSYAFLHFSRTFYPLSFLLFRGSEFYIRDGVFLIGFFAIARFISLYFYILQQQGNSPDFIRVMAYFWYPCIIFSGPVEFFEDFTPQKTDQETTKQGFFLIISGLLRAIVAEAIFWGSDFANINEHSTHGSIFLYLLSCFWLVHFRLSSYIYFTRGFSWLYGIKFDRPVFNKSFSASSPLLFFSRWNMGTARFISRYFFGCLYSLPLWLLPFFLFGFWIFFSVVIMFSNPDLLHRLIFGAMISLPIAAELTLMRLRVIYPKLRWLKIPHKAGNVLTLIYLHLMFAFGSEKGVMVFEKIFDIINALLPKVIN